MFTENSSYQLWDETIFLKQISLSSLHKNNNKDINVRVLRKRKRLLLMIKTTRWRESENLLQ